MDDFPGIRSGLAEMTKEELVEKINGLLKADDDLSFLLKLSMEDQITLIANIRESLNQVRDELCHYC